MKEWRVYLHGKLIDCIFYDLEYTKENKDKVYSDLVEKDGYDTSIEVTYGKREI